MSSIAIVTDSTADLPPEIASAHGITVVPLEVNLGGTVYRDGVDLGTGEFFRRVEEDKLRPLTSQPPLGEFIRVYHDLLNRFQSVISLHISDSFSGTVTAAKLARDAVPGADITVVDSGAFTLSLGLQAIGAAKAALAGWSKERLLRWLAEAGKTSRLIGVLDTLDYLRSGGRISRVGQLLGTLLRVKPVIRVGDGSASSIGMIRRAEYAAEAIATRLEPLIHDRSVRLGVVHTVAAEAASALRRRIEERFGPVDLFNEAGPVVACHVGPRALGVAVVPCPEGL